MNKIGLKTQLMIAIGELEADLENENGCFDEIANNIFMLAFSCEDLLDKSSNDVLIQLDKSVVWQERREYIDGFYLSLERTFVNFTASDMDDLGEVYTHSVDEVDREIIVEVVKELIKMCEK